VPPGRPAALAAALRRVLDNAELGQRMGRAGRRRVEERFSWASVAERTDAIYRDAIAGFARADEGA
jgi:glycosyltransferase involved in cell wall biosynthesis